MENQAEMLHHWDHDPKHKPCIWHGCPHHHGCTVTAAHCHWNRLGSLDASDLSTDTESVTSSCSSSRTNNAPDWPSQGHLLEGWLHRNLESIKGFLQWYFPLLWAGQVLLPTQTPKVEKFPLSNIERVSGYWEQEKKRWMSTISMCSKHFLSGLVIKIIEHALLIHICLCIYKLSV